MAPVTIPIKKGPQTWNINLNLFDPRPEGGGARKLRFLMAGYGWFSLELTGLDRPVLGRTEEPWIFRGSPVGTLPKEFRIVDGPDPRLAVHWSPFKHEGYVELEPISPCHSALLSKDIRDGIRVGYCQTCGQPVTRINPDTNVLEWLDGGSHLRTGVDLRPVVGVLQPPDSDQTVLDGAITVERRTNDWMAFVTGNRAAWGCGASVDAAIGSVIRSHPKLLAKAVSPQEDQS